MRMSAIFLVIVMLASLEMLAFQGASSEPSGRVLIPGTISTDTVYPEGVYEVNTLVRIESGARVVFEAGSTINVQGVSGLNGFSVSGSLFLNGTVSNPIRVGSSSAIPSPGYWYTIAFLPGSTGRLNFTRLEHAREGLLIFFATNVQVRNSEVRNCSGSGIYLQDTFSGGKYILPERVVIENTKFYDNPIGITENGNGTIIRNCRFEYNKKCSILFAAGIVPFSKGALVKSCTFRENRPTDIWLNSTDDEFLVNDLTIYSCIFQNQVVYTNYHINSTGRISGLKVMYNNFYESLAHTRIYIEYGRNMLFQGNTMLPGKEEAYFDSSITIWGFDNLTVKWNYFTGTYPDSIDTNTDVLRALNGNQILVYGNNFLKGSRTNIWIENATDVIVQYNSIYDRGCGIRVHESAPVRIQGNHIDKTSRQEPGIQVAGSGYARKSGDVIVENNDINNSAYGLYFGTNGRNIIRNNVFNNTETYGWLYISAFYIDEEFLIENCTILDHENEGTYVSSFACNTTITLVNTTINRTDLELRPTKGGPSTSEYYRIDIIFRDFLKMGCRNELGDGVDFHLNVSNTTMIDWFKGDFHHTTPLISCPEYHLFRDTNPPYNIRMVDPKSTICTYEATSGSGSHIGKVNLSKYTEIDLVLDQKPVFLGHDELNLMEDTRLAFDLNEIFSDLDDLDISVASQISNLSFSDGYVTNSVENWTGTESLLFRAVDTMGNSTEGTIEFNVGPVNDLPVFDPLLPEITINEDSETYLNLSHHIKDGDGDGVNVSIGQVDGLTLDLDTAAWNLTISSDMDWFGTADIPVYLNDTHGETRGVIRLDVLPINDPPYFNIPPSWNVTVEKGKVYEVNLSGMVLDVDSEIVALNVASDHATITGRVLHILYPEGSDRTLETLTITADDGGGGTATCQLTVYIKNGSIGPKPEWELYSADVSHDRSGNWEVEAVGAAGREVYIVIEGVGSFKLEEDQEHPGFYSTVVPSNLFTAGERYRYHFTDRSGGEDLAPTLSDELIQPMVGTEEDEEEKYFLSPWAIVCCMVAFVIVLLLLVMVVMLLTMGRRGQPEE